MKRVVEHLAPALGEWLTLPECVALTELLGIADFRCEDDFIISDPINGYMIGFRESARIAACFFESEKINADQLYMLRFDKSIEDRYHDVLSRIFAANIVEI